MEILFGIAGSFIWIAIIVGVIAAIVALVRRRAEGRDEPGIGNLRRLFFYGLSLAALIAAAAGVVLLLRSILDTMFGPETIAVQDTTLALGLALTIVGTPVWLIFWSMTLRSVRQFPVETRSATRKLYLYLVLGGSAITVSIAAIMFLQWVFGADDFTGTPFSLVVVWGGVWAYHWLVEGREGQPSELTLSIRRVYVYGLALLSVVLLALGVGGVLGTTLDVAYEALFGAELLTGEPLGLWSEPTRISLAMALVGGALWWWHWHRVASGDVRSTLRLVYVYLFTVFGGAASVVIALTVLLYHVLQWFFGSPDTASGRLHFDVLPGLFAGATVGGGLWAYHWAVVQQEATGTQRELVAARRVYGYLISAVGLVTLGVGLVIVFSVVIGLLSPGAGSQIIGDDEWRNPLVLAITLLVVGGPVWGLYWRDMQRIAIQGGPEERTALSRRAFTFLIFGISVLLTLINLSIVLFRLFDAALGSEFTSNLLWEIRWSIGILLTAGAVSLYYWLVLREDRQVVAQLEEATALAGAPSPEVRPRKAVTVLASDQDLPLVRRLEARLGYGVQVWQRIEAQGPAPTVSDEHLTETEQRIVDADSDRVLLLIGADGIHVVPYSNS